MQPEIQARRGRRAGAPHKDWRSIVEAFRRSGLTRREFCDQTGVPPSTLNWWLTRARRATTGPPIAFTEVGLPCPPGAPVPQPHPWVLEIVFNERVTIRSRDPIAVSDLGRLLRAARC